MMDFSIPAAVFVIPILMCAAALHRWMMTRENNKGQALVASIGDELGLEFEANPMMLRAFLGGFQMVSRATNPEFANCLSGELLGENIHVFNFQGNENDITVYGHTVVVLEHVKAGLPPFQIEPRGYLDKKLSGLANDEREILRDCEDLRGYRIASSSFDEEVEKLFTPEVCSYLRDKNWHIESGLHHLLVYKYNKIVRNTQFQDFAEEVIEFYRLLAGANAGQSGARDQIVVGDDGRLRLEPTC